MKRTIDIELSLQPGIDAVPPQYGDPYKQACTGDGITIETWRKTWTDNYKFTHDRFGSLGDNSVGQLYGINRHRPCVVVGSGPSLKDAIPALVKNKLQPNPVTTISCLHNFGYFEDEGCHSDYYITLDAGDIVLDDVWQGRKHPAEYYWEKTKDKILLASAVTPPKLFDAWKGKVYLFNILLPDLPLRQEFAKVEVFNHYISCGGNALGGCVYLAKTLFGSGEIIIVGGDFCFGYTHQFHSYETPYDNIKGKGVGNVIRWPDIYGISRVTWPSYLNFKFWFDWLTLNIPGRWSSASEGIFGSYPEGNLKSVRYGILENLLETYQTADVLNIGEYQFVNGVMSPKVDEKGVMIKTPKLVSEIWKDPKQPMEITFF